jgi:hypothetical protein
MAAGLTQEELADRSGLSVRGINDLERGARLVPRRDTATLLASALCLAGQDRAVFLSTGRAAKAQPKDAPPDANLPAMPARSEPIAAGKPPNGAAGPRVAEIVRTSAGTMTIQTFLIADIRGNTQYTVRHGDEAGARLSQRFAQLVQEVVEPGGGVLVELRGDEALVVFASARQALCAAVALQARFAGARDEPRQPLPVGIGLDAG